MFASTILAFALPLLAAAAPMKKSSGARATYYDTSVGLGACGELHQNSEYTVAMNSAQFGSGYPSDQCGRSIWITYGGKTVTAVIKDECPSCPYNGLDLSEGLFSALADKSLGVLSVDWGYGSGSSDSTPTTTTEEAEPTSTYVAPTSTSTYVAPTSTYVAPTSTSTYVAPTSTYVAPTSTSTYVAPTSTSVAPVEAAVETTSTSAAAAAAETSSAAETTECPANRFILYNGNVSLYDQQYFNKQDLTLLYDWAVKSELVSLLANTTSYCLNGTSSTYNSTDSGAASSLLEFFDF